MKINKLVITIFFLLSENFASTALWHKKPKRCCEYAGSEAHYLPRKPEDCIDFLEVR